MTATSDSTLKIRRMPLMTAKVNVKWNGDRTTLQPAPGEVWILQGINALTIYPKLHHTLSRAFAPASDGRPHRLCAETVPGARALAARRSAGW